MRVANKDGIVDDHEQRLHDMLKPVVNAISGFSLKHLKTDAQCAGSG